MLAVPADWYFAVPGVTTTGPFNQHFIRDIGLIFVLIGVAYIWGAGTAGDARAVMGRGELLACGARAVSPVGGRGRYLRNLRHRAGLSGW